MIWQERNLSNVELGGVNSPQGGKRGSPGWLVGSSFLRFGDRVVSVAIYTITQNSRLLRDSLKVSRVCMQMLLKIGGIVEMKICGFLFY